MEPLLAVVDHAPWLLVDEEVRLIHIHVRRIRKDDLRLLYPESSAHRRHPLPVGSAQPYFTGSCASARAYCVHASPFAADVLVFEGYASPAIRHELQRAPADVASEVVRQLLADLHVVAEQLAQVQVVRPVASLVNVSPCEPVTDAHIGGHPRLLLVSLLR